MRRLSLSLLVFVSILGGCKKEVPPATAPVAVAPTPPPPPPAPAPTPVQKMVQNFQRVNFDYDSSSLTASSQAALQANAEIMRAESTLQLEVQGHCDERGTTTYNLALGNRRAAVIRDYLVSQGVAPSRITTVSYGEERPLVGGEGETAWAADRRAEFRIRSGGDGAVAGTTTR